MGPPNPIPIRANSFSFLYPLETENDKETSPSLNVKNLLSYTANSDSKSVMS